MRTVTLASIILYENVIRNKTKGIILDGADLNKVRVVVESNGDLVTYFPQDVFREIKLTGILIFSKIEGIMGLDILLLFEDGNTYDLVMSESCHSEIFGFSTRWSSFKELRKIKNHYKTDITFNSKDSIIFLSELI